MLISNSNKFLCNAREVFFFSDKDSNKFFKYLFRSNFRAQKLSYANNITWEFQEVCKSI